MKENRNNYFNLKTNMHRKLTAHKDQRITLRQWLCAGIPKDTGSRRLKVSLGTHRRA